MPGVCHGSHELLCVAERGAVLARCDRRSDASHNSANLALVAFAQRWQSANGQILVFFVITVAAAEVAVGLALLVTIFYSKKTTDIDEINSLKG